MSDDGKIIVDDDWKSQAQREKDELSEKLDQEPEEPREMPEANFQTHLEGLAIQSMMLLGLVEHPAAQGQRIFDPIQARFMIDTLVVLKDKTEGNRTPEEDEYLNKMIPELQMTFVEVTKMMAQQHAQSGAEGAVEGGDSPSPLITE